MWDAEKLRLMQPRMPLSIWRLVTLPKLNRTGLSEDAKKEVGRVLVALPLLALFILASHILQIVPSAPFALLHLDSGEIIWGDGASRIPILTEFYNIRWLDNLLSFANMYFMPGIYGYDPLARTQTISFLSDGGVVLGIWWLESLRGDGKPWFLRCPSILALAGQLVGFGVVCPLYCFLSYVYAHNQQPVTSNHRDSLAAILPALLVGYFIPACAMFFWPDLRERQAWLFLWQLYPVCISLVYHAVTITLLASRTGDPPIAKKLHRDLILVRLSVGLPVVLACTVWMWTRLASPSGLADIFIPSVAPSSALPDFTAFCGQFLRWDAIFVLGPTMVWVGYMLTESKNAGLLDVGWIKLSLGALAITAMVGPGATIGLGWWWREEVIAAKHEKEVLLQEVVAKVDALLKANGA